MDDRSALTLFHVRGVPIRAHWTLWLILPYLAVVLSVQLEAVAHQAGVDATRLALPPLVWGALLAVGVFASVAAHEVAHTITAIRSGGRVRSITLMLLGGTSNVSRMPSRPRDEAWMALAGPLSSLLLGTALLAARHAAHAVPDAEMGLYYLGYTNLVLGAFNLIPAFPMDGGRVLRAVLAMRFGATRATRAAASVGRVIAVVMAVAGLWGSNFLLLMIALFIYSGAGLEQRSALVRDALAGLSVADLLPQLGRPPAVLPVGAPIADLLPALHRAGRLELLVTDAEGAPVTVVRASDLANLGAQERREQTLGELALRLGPRHVIVPWNTSANDALERASEAAAPYVIVADPDMPAGHGLIGLLTPADIQTMVTLRQVELRRAPPARGRAPSDGDDHSRAAPSVRARHA